MLFLNIGRNRKMDNAITGPLRGWEFYWPDSLLRDIYYFREFSVIPKSYLAIVAAG